MAQIILELVVKFLKMKMVKKKNYIHNKVGFLGKDLSVFEALLNISKNTKKILLENLTNYKKSSFSGLIIIIDDAFSEFDKASRYFLKDQEREVFLLLSEKMTEVSQYSNANIFIKPLKLFDLYEEIKNKIKKTEHYKFDWHLKKTEMSLLGPENQKLRLTEKEFGLLKILLDNRENSISKNKILKEVWKIDLQNSSDVSTRVFETLLSKIRKKLRQINSPPEIKISKSGYKIET
tara:strand:+ start:12654 stop:13358 length:705 start_codon:yes stop_codon:yes gene_type:complete